MDIVQEIRENRERGADRHEAEYRDRLLAVAVRVCGDSDDAESYVTQTFAEVIEHIETLTNPDSFFSWMCSILVNIHAKAKKRKEHERVVYTDDIPEQAFDGAGQVLAAVDAEILRDAIRELPKDMKESLILHYFMEMPVKKVAQILSVPVGTVMSRLYYARIFLGRRLGANLKKPSVAMIAAGLMLLGATAAVVVGVDALAAPETGETRSVASETGGTRSFASEISRRSVADRSQYNATLPRLAQEPSMRFAHGWQRGRETYRGRLGGTPRPTVCHLCALLVLCSWVGASGNACAVSIEHVPTAGKGRGGADANGSARVRLDAQDAAETAVYGAGRYSDQARHPVAADGLRRPRTDESRGPRAERRREPQGADVPTVADNAPAQPSGLDAEARIAKRPLPKAILRLSRGRAQRETCLCARDSEVGALSATR